MIPANRPLAQPVRWQQLWREAVTDARELLDLLGLSARAYHRVLRVARTAADLAGSADIDATHLSEAVQYRRFDFSRSGAAY